MGQTKDLFLQMRESELSTMYSSDFTKKDSIKQGKDLVNNILENGNVEPLKVWANIIRLKEVINSADAEFRAKLDIIEKESVNGVLFTHITGRKSIQYSDDEVWVELNEKIKEREALLKLATNSKDTIYDSEGVEVTKCSIIYSKDSINISF
jgi:hypothetical protein